MLKMIHPHRIQPEMKTVSDLMTFQGQIRIKPLKQGKLLYIHSNKFIFLQARYCGTCVILAFSARENSTNAMLGTQILSTLKVDLITLDRVIKHCPHLGGGGGGGKRLKYGALNVMEALWLP